jgi:uncharacterized Tic20 family protein
MIADYMILIINLIVIILGALIVWYSYKRDKTKNPDVEAKFAKKIVFLGLVIAVMNSCVLITNHIFRDETQPIYNSETNTVNVNLIENDNDKIEIISKPIAYDVYNYGVALFKKHEYTYSIILFESALNIIPNDEIFITKLIESKLKEAEKNGIGSEEVVTYFMGKAKQISTLQGTSVSIDKDRIKAEMKYYNAVLPLTTKSGQIHNEIQSKLALTQEISARQSSNESNLFLVFRCSLQLMK